MPDASQPQLCRYRAIDRGEGTRCLQRHKWVHFMGDSTSRQLYEALLRLVGSNVSINHTKIGRYETFYNVSTDLGTSLSYVFKGKLMRMIAADGRETRDRLIRDDVKNAFFRSCAERQRFPDLVVMSVGIHEVKGWSGRRTPTLNVSRIRADAEELIAFLRSTGLDLSRLVWWKPFDFKILWSNNRTLWRRTREVYREANAQLLDLFRRAGARTADFEQTTINARSDTTGIHYRLHSAFHLNVLLNMMCNNSPVQP